MGKLDIWAAAAVQAIGTVNSLIEKSFDPFVTVSDINDCFGTRISTVSQKSRSIQDMFNMSYFDAEFSSNQVRDQSPFNNTAMVDSYILPLDSLPDEYHELMRQARTEGEDINFKRNR